MNSIMGDSVASRSSGASPSSSPWVSLLVDLIVIGRRPHEPKDGGVARPTSPSSSAWPWSSVSALWVFAEPHALSENPAGVLRRVAHRVLAVDRQPVHLHHHHGQLLGAPEVPADRPDDRHRARPRDAGDLHRGRRRGDQRVQLGLLPLRGVPALDGRQAGQGGQQRRRPGGVRGEPPGQVRREPPARDQRVARHQALHHGERQAPDHADVPGGAHARDHGPPLRPGLDPRDLRPHPGPLPRLHGERLRADGAAAAVLPHRRPAAQAHLPVLRAGHSCSASSA